MHHHPYDSGVIYGLLAPADWGTSAAAAAGLTDAGARLGERLGRRQLTGIAPIIAGLVLLGLA